MRCSRLIAIVLGFRALVGCEDLPSGDTDADSGDTDLCLDACSTPHSGTTTSGGLATQVGSEGFWGCPVEGVEPIEDPADEDPRLGGSPRDVVAAHLGNWPLQIEELAKPTVAYPGLLTLVAGDAWRWVDVTDSTDCVDHVAVTVDAALARDAPALLLAGVVAVRPDGLGALVATAPSGDVGPEWAPPTTSAAWVRVEGPLGEVVLEASVSFADCPSTQLSCAEQEPFSTLTGIR